MPTPSKRRSIMMIKPANRHRLATCTVKRKGNQNTDSRITILLGKVSTHSNTLRKAIMLEALGEKPQCPEPYIRALSKVKIQAAGAFSSPV